MNFELTAMSPIYGDWGDMGGGFNILNLEGLLALYDPSDESTITSVGGSVSQIDDKSGNNNHATQSTGANQPTTGTRTINSLNGLDFNGSHLELPSGLLSLPTGPSTIYFVHQFDTVGGNQRLMQAENASNQVRYEFRKQSTTNRFLAGQGTTALVLDANDAITTTPRVLGLERDDSSNQLAFYDGAGTTVTGTSIGNQAAATFEIGRNTASNNQKFNGIMGEVIICNADHDAATKNQVGAYLVNKWGVPWTNF